MAKKQKYYVVWVGDTPGIYFSWEECKEQINGYPEAKYKSFKTLQEAEEAYENGFQDYWGVDKKEQNQPISKEDLKKYGKPIPNSISVDGACSGNPGKSEYQGVYTDTRTELFKVGPFDGGTNNIMEFLAIVHALAYCKQNKLPDMPIYSDSTIAMGWVRLKTCKTKLERTSKNQKVFELILRGEKWLRENTYQNPILKWETKAWGENPADFGRK